MKFQLISPWEVGDGGVGYEEGIGEIEIKSLVIFQGVVGKTDWYLNINRKWCTIFMLSLRINSWRIEVGCIIAQTLRVKRRRNIWSILRHVKKKKKKYKSLVYTKCKTGWPVSPNMTGPKKCAWVKLDSWKTVN